MHTKTDSEGTTMTMSTPARSPRRTVYYVQSPSRDSHDGEKTTTSFRSSPILSPTVSPPPSGAHHSRESSTSRFSGSLKPAPRKTNGRTGDHPRRDQKQWDNIETIEEEGLLDDEDNNPGIPRRCYFLAFVLCFFLIFSVFSLILWSVSKPQKPKITVTSITFQQFGIQAGSDSTGVATMMITIGSTVKMMYRNTAVFFGVHVTSTPIDLSYSDLTIASGSMKKFYQKRKSQRLVSISVTGNQIPLYGGGADLGTSSGTTSGPILLKLGFVVRSRAYVLGKFVKVKFYKKIACNATFDAKKIDIPIGLKNCSYDD